MPSFTYQDSEARKPFEEPGEYFCTIEDFEWKIASSGNDMLVLKLRTSGGALVFDNLVFTDKAFWKIDHALKAFMPSKGLKPPKKGEDFDMNDQWVTDNLKDATGWVLLSKGTTPGGKTRNNVDAYLEPKKGDRPAPAPTTKPAPAAPTSASATKPKPVPASKPDDDDEIPF
jgi:hypothetical protein